MSETNSQYVLFHAMECGSALPLVALRALNIPHEVVVCDFRETTRKQGRNYERLSKANPLAQFPTLITPEGSVITEMAAIILYLQDRHAKGTSWDIRNLAPSQLAAYYRWLVFIPANLYSALTIGEFPARFVQVPASGGIEQKVVEGWITTAAHTRRAEMWKVMEQGVPNDLGDGRFVLGTQQPTFLDVFLALIAHFMGHVGDDFGWLSKTCPTLFKSVIATLEVDVVKSTFTESNFTQYLDFTAN
ncbi:glutathione S-transferase [Ceratobasidium sp. AG-Ba]|nr:glutathione S-transferase [Ceratobasidium sp. AG-Ba]